MDPQLMKKTLQLAVKLQEAMHQLSVLRHEYPEQFDKLDDDAVGGADHRIALLTNHLIEIAAS
jgi:hypothetical protein